MSQIDVVGILNDNNKQILVAARPMKAEIIETAKMFEHPLESAESIVDHRIIMPVEISIQLWLPPLEYFSLYNSFKTIFIEGTTVFIKTRTAIYQNMVITEMPHKETPKVADAILLDLSLKELQTISTIQDQFAPQDPLYSDSVDRGEVAGSEFDVTIPEETDEDINFGFIY